MEDLKSDKRNDKFVFMIVYNQIQYDARVIRAAEAISSMNENVCVLSCNSDMSYENRMFKSISYRSKLKGPLLLFCFWFYTIVYALKERNHIKIIYVHDYFMTFTGLLISSIIHKKWVYDAHELLFQRKSHKYTIRELFFFFLERISIRKASLVIAANEEREKIIRRLYKLKNTSFVRNIAKFKSQKMIRKKDDIIVYQGVMSEERKVSLYIKRLKLLPMHIKLKLIGDGPDLGYYHKIVADLRLEDRVIFVGKVPYEDLQKESEPCKVGIVSYLMDDLNNYYCSPNKLYEYTALSIPVLVSPQPFFKTVIAKYAIGEVFTQEDSDDTYCNIIVTMLNKYETYSNNMASFLNDFSFEKEMERFMGKVKELLV